MVGQAGIWGALGILLIAKSITSLTALSISAISTNMQVRGGGAYFLISRVLGPEFGGAIGLALFFAQALSVPFYILGFTEALIASFPGLAEYFIWITMGTALMLLVVAYVGAGWAIKAQYFIMAVLFLALIFAFGGMLLKFSPEVFATNWGSGYTLLTPGLASGGKFNFWMIFAIYFPAVTGILAGVNMSGDLKDPTRSIPRGTLFALGLTFLVYFLLIIIMGGAFSRADLIATPYENLKNHALFGMGFMVAAGVFAASLSSALGSYLGAPRILQAVARDKILGLIRPFAKGTPQGDEPRRALLLTGLITFAVLYWAGNAAEGGSLNIVASIITMFFLYTYGMINIAAFIEAFGKNPSFRPRFRFFHWFTALIAAIGCVGAALLIDPLAAITAILILAGLLWYLQRKDLTKSFGDARRGFIYSNVRNNLLRLASMEDDPKNWRPTILAFSGNPKSREGVVTYAVWLEAGRGIALLANILPSGTVEQAARRRLMAENQLKEFSRERNLQAFPVIAIGDDLENTTAHLIQSTSIGPIRPNICLFGWSQEYIRAQRLLRMLRVGKANGTSLVLVSASPEKVISLKPTQHQKLFIDVWWRGHANGQLLIILAHLLTQNWEWSNSELRIIRVVEDEAGVEPATKALEELLDKARVDARAVTLVRGHRSFKEVLTEQSSWADCVFLGFELPDESQEEDWYQRFSNLLENMPPCILVNSSLQNEDILT